MLQTVWIRGEGINPRQFCSKSPIDGGCDLGGFVLGDSVLPCHKRGVMTWGVVRGVMSDHLQEQLVVCESYVYEMLLFPLFLRCLF